MSPISYAICAWVWTHPLGLGQPIRCHIAENIYSPSSSYHQLVDSSWARGGDSWLKPLFLLKLWLICFCVCSDFSSVTAAVSSVVEPSYQSWWCCVPWSLVLRPFCSICNDVLWALRGGYITWMCLSGVGSPLPFILCTVTSYNCLNCYPL